MLKNGIKNKNDTSVFIVDQKSNNNDITLLSVAQLQERLERQNKLIASGTLSRLSDKGEKVKLLKKQLEEEIEKRNKVVDISDFFTGLSLKEKGIDNLEWGEKDITKAGAVESNEIDFDDKDPLAILATHSGTNLHKIRLNSSPDPPLITNDDLYVLNLCTKVDKALPKEKFLPYKTLISSRCLNRNKTRDLSAATPPLPVYDDTKLISLQESFRIQIEQDQRLKEIQIKIAADRLKNSLHKIGDCLTDSETFQNYRETEPIIGSDAEESTSDIGDN